MRNKDLKILQRYEFAKKLYYIQLILAIFIIPILIVIVFISEQNPVLKNILPIIMFVFIGVFLPLGVYVSYKAYFCPYCHRKFKVLGYFGMFPNECNHCGRALILHEDK